METDKLGSPELVCLGIVLHAYRAKRRLYDLTTDIHILTKRVKVGVLVSKLHIDGTHQHERVGRQTLVYHSIG